MTKEICTTRSHKAAVHPTRSLSRSAPPNASGGAVVTAAEMSSAPAFRSGSPEWYRRVADKCERSGDHRNAGNFRRAATQAEEVQRRRVLGSSPYLAINAAHFMAACLRSKRKLPLGASIWMARHALTEWLPTIPTSERTLIVATLRKCDRARLGKELADLVGRE